MFDPPERVPYNKIPYSENDSAAHRQLALDAERESIVLLKNQGGILPLKSSVKKIAVVGPSANDPIDLLGNYNGISSRQVTPLEGITKQFANAEIEYSLGATFTPTTPALMIQKCWSLPMAKARDFWPNTLTTPISRASRR